MSCKEPIRIAVTGAAGNIGYATLFRIASGAVFGPDRPVALNLIEVGPGLEALKGVVMELEDCAFPLLTEIVATGDLNEGFKNADWALLIGAVPRKPGMERKDLLGINGKIFVEQGRALAANAKKTCKVIVVGNPCNTNALIALRHADGIPAENFFAMTRLDENRAKSQLTGKTGIHNSEIKNVVIWGNHSSTQYPDINHATIAGKAAPGVVADEAWVKDTFIPTVQKRGAAIIKARGASSAASAASAALDTVKALFHPTPAGEWHAAGVVSKGEYGVTPGLVYGYPIRTRADGSYEVVQGLSLDAFSTSMMKATEQELIEERDSAAEALGTRL